MASYFKVREIQPARIGNFSDVKRICHRGYPVAKRRSCFYKRIEALKLKAINQKETNTSGRIIISKMEKEEAS